MAAWSHTSRSDGRSFPPRCSCRLGNCRHSSSTSCYSCTPCCQCSQTTAQRWCSFWRTSQSCTGKNSLHIQSLAGVPRKLSCTTRCKSHHSGKVVLSIRPGTRHSYDRHDTSRRCICSRLWAGLGRRIWKRKRHTDMDCSCTRRQTHCNHSPSNRRHKCSCNVSCSLGCRSHRGCKAHSNTHPWHYFDCRTHSKHSKHSNSLPPPTPTAWGCGSIPLGRR